MTKGVQRLLLPQCECCQPGPSGGAVHLEVWHQPDPGHQWEEHHPGSSPQPRGYPRSCDDHRWDCHLQWKTNSNQSKLDENTSEFNYFLHNPFTNTLSNERRRLWFWKKPPTRWPKLWGSSSKAKDIVSTSERNQFLSEIIKTESDIKQNIFSLINFDLEMCISLQYSLHMWPRVAFCLSTFFTFLLFSYDYLANIACLLCKCTM